MSMLISNILKHIYLKKKICFLCISHWIQVPTSHDIPRHPTTSHLPGSTRTRFWASLPGLTPLGVAATAGDEALVNLGEKTLKAQRRNGKYRKGRIQIRIKSYFFVLFAQYFVTQVHRKFAFWRKSRRKLRF